MRTLEQNTEQNTNTQERTVPEECSSPKNFEKRNPFRELAQSFFTLPSWAVDSDRINPVLQGLFFLSLFFITVIGILLLGGPDSLDSIQNYNSPERVEARKKITKQMAGLLAQNPQLLAQMPQTLDGKSSPRSSQLNSTSSQMHRDSPPLLPPLVSQPMDFSFQGENIHFENQLELNRWVFEHAKKAPMELVEHLEKGIDPDLKIEILKRVLEVDDSPSLKEKVLDSVIREGSLHFGSPDERSQQLAQKYFNYYLETESDSDRGKKRIDEILKRP